VRGEKFDKTVICKLAGLRESIHAFADFGVDVSVMDEGFEVVELYDGVRQEVQRDSDVLEIWKIATKVEIFQVDGHESAVGRTDDAIEEELSCRQVGSLRGLVARIVDAVATSGPADAAGIGFFRSVGADDADVGWDFAFRDLGAVDEPERVGPGGHVGIGAETLEHAANFVGVRIHPEMAVSAFAECGVLGDAASIGVQGGAMTGPVFGGQGVPRANALAKGGLSRLPVAGGFAWARAAAGFDGVGHG
jgi:hypothetical protein